MAIVEMQKLSVAADKKNRKALLETLQSMSIMQIENDHLTDPDLQKMDTRSSIAAFERNADELDQALKLLKTYGVSSGGGLFSEPDLVTRQQFDDIITNQQIFMRSAARILDAQKKIDEANGIIQKDTGRLTALSPWMGLDIPLDWKGTKTTSAFIGTMAQTLTADQVYALATNGLDDPCPADVNVIGVENNLTYVCVLCHNKIKDIVEANLRSGGFSRPAQMESGLPSAAKEKLEKDIADKKAQIESLKKEILSQAESKEQFKIASDYYRTRAEKYRTLGTIPQSENVFFLEGWVPKEKADDVAKLLTDRFGAVVDKEEVREDEMEPTLLRNNWFSRNVEGVLESYGLPQPKRADPTFIMSFFYVIFFGMMLSDAGYGIVMAIACAIILYKKKRLNDGMKKMLRLFFWCGLSTTFWGFMYGSFFGDAIDVIAKTFFGYTGPLILKPLWFAPMDNPMRLLVWCMLFGLIHLFFGLGIKGYECLKSKDIVGFISDVFAWYLFVGGLTLLLIPSSIFGSIAGQQFYFPAAVTKAAKIMTWIGVVIILFMGGRDKKNWAIRIALGAYDLYGISGWLSDVLSYSRLLALGLATGVIASVINMMASMFGGGPVGAVLFAIIFILGHTLNIGINALGAYVHTNRLQYVEFFGKFYDAGGRPFKPFKQAFKYVSFKEEKQS